MAVVSRALCLARSRLFSCRNVLFAADRSWNNANNSDITGKRYLFCSEYVGIENFKRQKAIMSDEIGSLKGNFMKKVKSYVEESDQNSIFTEDLKMVVYFAETTDDLDLVAHMIRKYHSQNVDLKFSAFRFGPLVMRLLYIHQNHKLAYQLFNDKSLDGFFNQMTTCVTYMDLLYVCKEYEKVIEAMHEVARRHATRIKYPVDCMTLAAAAAYKMNTKESLEKLKALLLSAKSSECDLSLRTVIYSSFLAYKQQDAKLALEMLSLLSGNREVNLPSAYINLKSLIYAELGRFEEALHILSSYVNRDRPGARRIDIFQEVLEKLKASITSSSSPSSKVLLKSVNQFESNLQSTGYLLVDSFETYLDSTIKKKRGLQDGFKQRERIPIGGYRRDSEGVFSGSQRRRGLL